MKCSNVTVQLKTGESYCGTLELSKCDGEYCLSMELRPNLLQTAGIVAATVLEYPEDFLCLVGGMIFKAMVAPNAVGSGSAFGEDVKEAISECRKFVFGVALNAEIKSSINGAKILLDTSGKRFSFVFPDVSRASKFYDVIKKIEKGKRPFVW